LAVYFIQVFVSSWRFEFLSVETFVFIFTMFFLFGDVYSNNNFLQNRFLFENQKKTAELNEIVSAIMPVRRGSRIVSNFCPAEISSKLGEPVIEIKGELVPAESFSRSDLKTIYIVDRPSRSDSLYHEGKILMRNSCEFGGSDHFIDVIEREGNNK